MKRLKEVAKSIWKAIRPGWLLNRKEIQISNPTNPRIDENAYFYEPVKGIKVKNDPYEKERGKKISTHVLLRKEAEEFATSMETGGTTIYNPQGYTQILLPAAEAQEIYNERQQKKEPEFLRQIGLLTDKIVSQLEEDQNFYPTIEWVKTNFLELKDRIHKGYKDTDVFLNSPIGKEFRLIDICKNALKKYEAKNGGKGKEKTDDDVTEAQAKNNYTSGIGMGKRYKGYYTPVEGVPGGLTNPDGVPYVNPTEAWEASKKAAEEREKDPIKKKEWEERVKKFEEENLMLANKMGKSG